MTDNLITKYYFEGVTLPRGVQLRRKVYAENKRDFTDKLIAVVVHEGDNILVLCPDKSFGMVINADDWPVEFNKAQTLGQFIADEIQKLLQTIADCQTCH